MSVPAFLVSNGRSSKVRQFYFSGEAKKKWQIIVLWIKLQEEFSRMQLRVSVTWGQKILLWADLLFMLEMQMLWHSLLLLKL